MYSAQKYLSNHSVQARGAKALLEKFKPKMKWTDKQRVVDIGCGPGDITHNFLLPLIPNDGKLVGVDISEPMIQVAKRQYTDPRLNFEVMDITKSKIAEKYESYFDSAISFYCMQWVQDQRSALKNIHSILKPEGETLSTSVVDAINYPIYEFLAASPKWSPYMINYQDAIPPYRKSADPVSDVGNLMRNVGFQIEECFLETDFYTFPSKQLFYKWMDGLNPFLKNIPAHLLEEFDKEWKNVVFFDDLCSLNESTNEVTITYTTITVFARKVQSLQHLHLNSSLPY